MLSLCSNYLNKTEYFVTVTQMLQPVFMFDQDVISCHYATTVLPIWLFLSFCHEASIDSTRWHYLPLSYKCFNNFTPVVFLLQFYEHGTTYNSQTFQDDVISCHYSIIISISLEYITKLFQQMTPPTCHELKGLNKMTAVVIMPQFFQYGATCHYLRTKRNLWTNLIS